MAIRLSGLNSGLDTESIIKELVSAKSMKVTSLKKAQTRLSWKQDAWKNLNSKIYSLYTDTISNLRWDKTFIKKKTEVSDSSVLSVTAGTEAPIGVQDAHVESLAKSAYLTGGQISTTAGESVTGSTKLADLGVAVGEKLSVTTNGETYVLEVTDATTMNDWVSKLKEAGLNASFDETNQRMYISAKKTGTEYDFSFGGSDTSLSALGLAVDGSKKTATKIDAGNAVLVLNKVRYESSSNNIVINGSTYELKGVSSKNEDGSYKDTSITTNDDFDEVYNVIKDFVTKYNELINEMTKLYNADSASSYQPLTSEEKDAMTDEEVKEWETKIKDSLLSRDTSLSTIMNVMTSTMAEGVEIDGKKVYLSNYGISTLGYLNAGKNEQNAYHIDGDKTDASTSSKTDKLKTALATNGEGVVEFFTALGNKLYSNMTNAMQRIDGVRSIYKVYNDKQMADEYSQYTKKISEAEERLTAYEDKWYKKFTAMETALSKMSTKQSAISGLFSS